MALGGSPAQVDATFGFLGGVEHLGLLYGWRKHTWKPSLYLCKWVPYRLDLETLKGLQGKSTQKIERLLPLYFSSVFVFFGSVLMCFLWPAALDVEMNRCTWGGNFRVPPRVRIQVVSMEGFCSVAQLARCRGFFGCLWLVVFLCFNRHFLFETTRYQPKVNWWFDASSWMSNPSLETNWPLCFSYRRQGCSSNRRIHPFHDT